MSYDPKYLEMSLTILIFGISFDLFVLRYLFKKTGEVELMNTVFWVLTALGPRTDIIL